MEEDSIEGIINKKFFLLRGDFSFDSVIDKKTEIIEKIKEVSAFEQSKIIEGKPKFILRGPLQSRDSHSRDTETESLEEAKNFVKAGYCVVSAEFPFRGRAEELHGSVAFHSQSSRLKHEGSMMLHLDAPKFKSIEYLDRELKRLF
jgi:hypothetical protein